MGLVANVFTLRFTPTGTGPSIDVGVDNWSGAWKTPKSQMALQTDTESSFFILILLGLGR